MSINPEAISQFLGKVEEAKLDKLLDQLPRTS